MPEVTAGAWDGFAERLRRLPVDGLQKFAESEILDGVPYIFSGDDDFARFQKHVLTLVEISTGGAEVLLVGSAKTGFSMGPDGYAQPFRDSSDLDVAVVCSELFEQAWGLMLAWDYRTIRARTKSESDWLQQRRNQTFSGWYLPREWSGDFRLTSNFPEALRPLRDLGLKWFSAFQSLSRYQWNAEVAKHSAKARLYRSREHLVRYQAWSMRELRAKLTSG